MSDSEKQTSHAVHYVLLVCVTFFWAGAFTTAKIAVVNIPPFSLAALRFLLAGAILLVILQRKEGLTKQLTAKTAPWALLLGALGVFGYSALLFWGVKFSTATNGSLIAGANPAATTLLAALLIGERITRRIVGGIILSFIGVSVLITKGSLDVVLGLSLNIGDVFLLGSLVCFAGNSIVAKKAMKFFSPWGVTALSSVVGAIILLPFAGWEIANGKWGSPTLTDWLCVLYLAIFASVLAYAWYFAGIKAIGAGKASIFTNVVPVVGTIIAVVALGETLVPAHYVGAVLVVGGVLIVTRSPKPAPAPQPAAAKA